MYILSGTYVSFVFSVSVEFGRGLLRSLAVSARTGDWDTGRGDHEDALLHSAEVLLQVEEAVYFLYNRFLDLLSVPPFRRLQESRWLESQVDRVFLVLDRSRFLRNVPLTAQSSSRKRPSSPGSLDLRRGTSPSLRLPVSPEGRGWRSTPTGQGRSSP